MRTGRNATARIGPRNALHHRRRHRHLHRHLHLHRRQSCRRGRERGRERGHRRQCQSHRFHMRWQRTAFARQRIHPALPESFVDYFVCEQRLLKFRERHAQDPSTAEPQRVRRGRRCTHQVQRLTRTGHAHVEAGHVIKDAPHLRLTAERLQQRRILHDRACQDRRNGDRRLGWIRCKYRPIASTTINRSHDAVQTAKHYLIKLQALTGVDGHDSHALSRRGADATRFNAGDKVTWPRNICLIGIMSHDRQLM